jgi:hypothetical protein
VRRQLCARALARRRLRAALLIVATVAGGAIGLVVTAPAGGAAAPVRGDMFAAHTLQAAASAAWTHARSNSALFEVAIVGQGANFYFTGAGRTHAVGWRLSTRRIGRALTKGLRIGPATCDFPKADGSCGFLRFDPSEPARLLHEIRVRPDNHAFVPTLITETSGFGWEIDGTTSGRLQEYTAPADGRRVRLEYP